MSATATEAGPSDRLPPDIDRRRAMERRRQAANRTESAPKQGLDPKVEYQKLLDMKSGGTYIPPARLRALQEQIEDKTSKEYQRLAWDNLRKSINGLINKVNTSNIQDIVQDLFKENLIRGRGLFVRSIMRAQSASLPFTPIYAALAAIINTKLPQIGELLLTRLIIQFRKAFRRNDKPLCLSSTMFLAHLCNHQVAHEIIALQIMHLLLEHPTDDSVEIAVGFIKEAGAFLAEASPAANNGVFERLRAVLHEGQLEKRTQYMIEVLFKIRRDNYKDNPAIPSELDLVEEEDQITHMIGLDDELQSQDTLNVFKLDEDYQQNEERYSQIRAEILGENSEEESEEEGEEEEEQGDEAEGEPGRKLIKTGPDGKTIEIKDLTDTELVNLRKTIYLTIMSSMDFEEACHKLARMSLPPGQEMELVNMVIECCSQEKIYSKFYGLIGQRFCFLNRMWNGLFCQAFENYYTTIHRYETNKLRNIANFFAFLLATDAIPWTVFECVHMNEEETTSSSRIFIKVLFQEMQMEMGTVKIVERLKEEPLQPYLTGMMPKDNIVDCRFSINYFTAIGFGAVTEGMRDWLKAELEKPPPPKSRSPSIYSSDYSEDYEDRGRPRERQERRRSRSWSSRSGSYSGSSYSSYSSGYDSDGRSYYSSRSRSTSRSRSYSSSSSRRSSRGGGSTSPTRRTRRYSPSSISRSPSPYATRSRPSPTPSPRSRSRSPSPPRGRSRVRQYRGTVSTSLTPGGRRRSSGQDTFTRGRARNRTRERSRSRDRSKSHSPTRHTDHNSPIRSPPMTRNKRQRRGSATSPPVGLRGARSPSPFTKRARLQR